MILHGNHKLSWWNIFETDSWYPGISFYRFPDVPKTLYFHCKSLRLWRNLLLLTFPMLCIYNLLPKCVHLEAYIKINKICASFRNSSSNIQILQFVLKFSFTGFRFCVVVFWYFRFSCDIILWGFAKMLLEQIMPCMRLLSIYAWDILGAYFHE